MVKRFCFVSLLSLSLLGSSQGPRREEPAPVRLPEDERATFQLEPGLDIQLVAAEPLVEDPVVIQFDPDGRLWVVEMRGFMPDLDGTGETERTGRISVLEDQDGDGRMDRRTTYLDSLVLPRALALVKGGALVAENGALWLTQDRNGDLKADSKNLIDQDYAGSTMPEHAGNGLWRGVDNAFYNAKSRFRYRLVNGSWKRDSTEFRGQWGLSHDDHGRLVYNYNWSQLHGDLVPPNTLSRNRNHTPTTGIDHGLTLDRRVYPVRATPAVNRGYIPGTLDTTGRLREFTAACSPLAYRGTALPTDFRGNIFVCEPAGNLVKRNVVTDAQALIPTARDPHPDREFLASTDERFRPVHLASGPDGALYVADMYRGLIQHGAYVTPYLREQTLARGLDQPVHRGRIWRVVPKGWQASKSVKLSAMTTDELVRELSHPDGWHRDVAQRLLVERRDLKTVPALTELTQRGTAEQGRFHALWTLAGLGQNRPAVLLGLLADPSDLVASTALRLLEPFAKTDVRVRAQLEARLPKLSTSASLVRVPQLAFTARVLRPAVSHVVLADLLTRHGDTPLIRDAVLSSLEGQESPFLQKLLAASDWQTREPAREIFLEMLTTAVVRNGNPTEIRGLLTRLEAGTGPLGWQDKAVLAGLSMGASRVKAKPIRLAETPQLVARLTGTPDASRLRALGTLFAWPGQAALASTVAVKNPLNDEAQALFAMGRQHYLTTCAGCHGTDGQGLSRFGPPLAGSDWVLGDEKRLALILLHGMEGPVDVADRHYDVPDILPVMPAHSTMDDGALTAILTYIRNEWGNAAGPVSRRTVGMTRITSQGRVVPWTARELNAYVRQANSNPNLKN
jgi:glucose/arabinose dehydrogenase/mono/diheme cytochrome c family protein